MEFPPPVPTPRSATADRLLAVEERLARIEARHAANAALIGEIHREVVGSGDKGSTVRERLSALETSNDWRHRAMYSVFPSLLVGLLAHLGLPVPVPGSQP